MHRLYRLSGQSADYLKDTEIIGCFYCRKRMVFEEVYQWIQEDKQVRGRCPHCGIDALLALDGYNSKHYPQILEEMLAAYFEKTRLLGEWLE